jgi:antirestriction protein ArdC
MKMTPTNYVTELPYSGKNALILASSGYKDPRFLTFLQAKQAGLMIRKGEKGIPLMRVIRNEKKEDEKKRNGLRGFVVFNIEQTEVLATEDDSVGCHPT